MAMFLWGRDEVCSSSMFLDFPRSTMSPEEEFVSGDGRETKRSSLSSLTSTIDGKVAYGRDENYSSSMPTDLARSATSPGESLLLIGPTSLASATCPKESA
jgi:hypothetical protein